MLSFFTSTSKYILYLLELINLEFSLFFIRDLINLCYWYIGPAWDQTETLDGHSLF